VTTDVSLPWASDRPSPRTRLAADPEKVERGLVQLVLTLVELVRQLMERQAIRRVEAGHLTPQQEEDLGLALMRLAEKMTELKEYFELDDDDLNLRLGPLGDLL
jgi:hypothetical protein